VNLGLRSEEEGMPGLRAMEAAVGEEGMALAVPAAMR